LPFEVDFDDVLRLQMALAETGWGAEEAVFGESG